MGSFRRWLPGRASLSLGLALAACASADRAAPRNAEEHLRQLLANANVTPLEPLPLAPEALVRLGQALFFDKTLSGNRDIGCSTCHNPVYHTSDLLMLRLPLRVLSKNSA